ncbi:hypothetical protein P606_25190 [Comamonas thiooxydans]|uniref:Uncharacterized protein n=2 Tax=Comamonas thiooxydans TaxID=363952 RepID=A0A0E3BCJ4_9BURK|nr:hypothetical protein P245_19660 [Comamonas thiooxydans]KGH18130.1 hypothetical protein P606_25190 [Comamonas thiooxydans]
MRVIALFAATASVHCLMQKKCSDYEPTRISLGDIVSGTTMTAEQLEAIREQLGYTQEQMADRLQCDFVGYRRYATGSRPIPRYIARCTFLLDFIRANGLKSELERSLDV